MTDTEALEREVKEFIISTLKLEAVQPYDIVTDAPLFGGGLGLDSVDALELGVALHKSYGVRIDSKSEESRAYLSSVRSLVSLIEKQLNCNLEQKWSDMIETIRKEVLVVLKERFEIDPTTITLESRFKEDLDLDSIDIFDLIGELEKRTGIKADLSDFVKAKTFGDFLQVQSIYKVNCFC